MIDIDRKPCWFPIHHADSSLSDLCHCIYDITYFISLPLRGCCIHRGIIIVPFAHYIRLAVSILHRACPGGLRYHYLFIISSCYIAQYICKILQCSMPIWIVGRCKYIIIYLICIQFLRITLHIAGFLWVCKVNGS